MADVKDFFENTLPQKLQDHPELSAEINNTYQFEIEDAGTWAVDLTKTPGEVAEGALEEPGCVVTANATDFAGLLDNPASGMMLFSMGRLKVTNVGLALSLQKLLG